MRRRGSVRALALLTAAVALLACAEPPPPATRPREAPPAGPRDAGRQRAATGLLGLATPTRPAPSKDDVRIRELASELASLRRLAGPERPRPSDLREAERLIGMPGALIRVIAARATLRLASSGLERAGHPTLSRRLAAIGPRLDAPRLAQAMGVLAAVETRLAARRRVQPDDEDLAASTVLVRGARDACFDALRNLQPTGSTARTLTFAQIIGDVRYLGRVWLSVGPPEPVLLVALRPLGPPSVPPLRGFVSELEAITSGCSPEGCPAEDAIHLEHLPPPLPAFDEGI